MGENSSSQYGRDMAQFSQSHLPEKDQILVLRNEINDVKIRENRQRKEMKIIRTQMLIQFGMLFILFISVFILSGLGYTILQILERNGL